MGEIRNAYILVEKLEGNHLGDLGVDGRIILEWILGKSGLGVLMIGFMWLRTGTSSGLKTFQYSRLKVENFNKVCKKLRVEACLIIFQVKIKTLLCKFSKKNRNYLL
jgi:hypothetical protein